MAIRTIKYWTATLVSRLVSGGKSDKGNAMVNDKETREALESRLVQLEELFSHQQHLVQQLNDEVVSLRATLDRLQNQAVAHEERLKWLVENRLTLDDLPNEKPPHY